MDGTSILPVFSRHTSNKNILCMCAHRAKLASLFGLCQAEPEGNESFKFTAPKQPKKVPPTLGMHDGTFQHVLSINISVALVDEHGCGQMWFPPF